MFCISNSHKITFRLVSVGISLEIQWLGFWAFTDGGPDSVPDQEIKILQVTWTSQKKKKKTSYCLICLPHPAMKVKIPKSINHITYFKETNNSNLFKNNF